MIQGNRTPPVESFEPLDTSANQIVKDETIEIVIIEENIFKETELKHIKSLSPEIAIVPYFEEPHLNLEFTAQTLYWSEINFFIKVNLMRFEKIQSKVNFISKNAEIELFNNIFLLDAVDKILEEILIKLRSTQMKVSLILDAFYDLELSDWCTFQIIIKTEETGEQFKTIFKLWEELSILSDDVLIKLSSSSDIFKSIINNLRSKIIISIDVD